jgi:hypothetical protein
MDKERRANGFALSFFAGGVKIEDRRLIDGQSASNTGKTALTEGFDVDPE